MKHIIVIETEKEIPSPTIADLTTALDLIFPNSVQSNWNQDIETPTLDILYHEV